MSTSNYPLCPLLTPLVPSLSPDVEYCDGGGGCGGDGGDDVGVGCLSSLCERARRFLESRCVLDPQ